MAETNKDNVERGGFIPGRIRYCAVCAKTYKRERIIDYCCSKDCAEILTEMDALKEARLALERAKRNTKKKKSNSNKKKGGKRTGSVAKRKRKTKRKKT